VICAILSSFFLNEKLTFFGWVGCFLCIVGSVIIALNGPKEQTIGQIREFQKLFLSVGFLVYGGVVIAASIIIIFFVAPKWGKTNMIWYILVCSLIGGLSVSCTQGLGASIVTSVRGDNQFNYWFTYFLLVFVIITLLTEVYYLNVALALFNTAMDPIPRLQGNPNSHHHSLHGLPRHLRRNNHPPNVQSRPNDPRWPGPEID
ncbi:hypothetical protein RSAG8_10230, partial [Rhizoctonia solani AG-8 WAC10335]